MGGDLLPEIRYLLPRRFIPRWVNLLQTAADAEGLIKYLHFWNRPITLNGMA